MFDKIKKVFGGNKKNQKQNNNLGVLNQNNQYSKEDVKEVKNNSMQSQGNVSGLNNQSSGLSLKSIKSNLGNDNVMGKIGFDKDLPSVNNKQEVNNNSSLNSNVYQNNSVPENTMNNNQYTSQSNLTNGNLSGMQQNNNIPNNNNTNNINDNNNQFNNINNNDSLVQTKSDLSSFKNKDSSLNKNNLDLVNELKPQKPGIADDYKKDDQNNNINSTIQANSLNVANDKKQTVINGFKSKSLTDNQNSLNNNNLSLNNFGNDDKSKDQDLQLMGNKNQKINSNVINTVPGISKNNLTKDNNVLGLNNNSSLGVNIGQDANLANSKPNNNIINKEDQNSSKPKTFSQINNSFQKNLLNDNSFDKKNEKNNFKKENDDFLKNNIGSSSLSQDNINDNNKSSLIPNNSGIADNQFKSEDNFKSKKPIQKDEVDKKKEKLDSKEELSKIVAVADSQNATPLSVPTKNNNLGNNNSNQTTKNKDDDKSFSNLKVIQSQKELSENFYIKHLNFSVQVKILEKLKEVAAENLSLPADVFKEASAFKGDYFEFIKKKVPNYEQKVSEKLKEISEDYRRIKEIIDLVQMEGK